MVNEVADNRLNAAHRDGEAEAFGIRAAGFGVDDADQRTAGVKEPAAGVARADGRVGLDEGHRRVFNGDFAAQRAYDAAGSGAAQFAERVADCNDVLADGEHIGIAQGCGGQTGCVNFEHGEVAARVGADQGRFILRVVVEDDLYGVHAVHNVLAGYDVAVAREDDAAAAAVLHLSVGIGRAAVEEVAVAAGGIVGVNADDGGRAELNNLSL
ncbi:hypothetical protein SDC9_103026 [bioreactor metagenome]|uniref:Uncharacterized protein n=1 Tax=bioreactor metagenome TaxID=1076179 RepID=A0A645B3D8_9ZZZZ